jgi:hypothetical protein
MSSVEGFVVAKRHAVETTRRVGDPILLQPLGFLLDGGDDAVAPVH